MKTLYQATKFWTLNRIERNCRRHIKKAVQKMISFFDEVRNIVGTGENAGYQDFLLFVHSDFKTTFWSV